MLKGACRVPMGYWSFIDVPDVPYINAGELDQLERVLDIAQTMGLYTVLVSVLQQKVTHILMHLFKRISTAFRARRMENKPVDISVLMGFTTNPIRITPISWLTPSSSTSTTPHTALLSARWRSVMKQSTVSARLVFDRAIYPVFT